MASTTNEASARRLCMNRLMICSRWLRARMVNSPATVPVVAGTVVCGPVCRLVIAASSVQPDTRVEHGVQEVRDEVRHDDEERRDHQPAEQHVHVLLADRVVNQ